MQNIAGWYQQTFCFQKFVDNSQQCFAFTPQANFIAQKIWIFSEDDGIKARLHFEIFSTLIHKAVGFIYNNILKKFDRFCVNGTIFARWIHFCTDDSDI